MIDVLIPCKGFSLGKSRLAPVLDPPARDRLCRALLDRTVLTALRFAGPDGRVAVVSADAEVRERTRRLGAGFLDDAGEGLNAALAAANQALGFEHPLIVLPIDLPRLETALLAALVAADREVVLAPDLGGTGTNALGLGQQARQGFPFAFGHKSFAAHAGAAGNASLSCRVVRDPALGFDLDLPEDLLRLQAHELQSFRCPGCQEQSHEAA